MSRLLFGFALLLTLAPPATANSPPDFDSTIAPLFIRRCISCHSGTEPKGGLDITRRASVIAGESPVLIPGKANESLLWKRVEANEMPPKSPLAADEKLFLKSWIEAGAKWGRDPIRPRADADWWAFKPITKPNVPNGEHPIDYFVRRELPPRGLTPTRRADRRTLIRRLFFDLTGLPPTNERIAAFESDDRPDAYEKLVDELLASPRYGERWARHWLDVAHYGETHGYDKDQPRKNAWPYRDYVIRSLNSDKPYARFVQEQIAGDVLFPGTVDGIEALGFLSAGPWDLIGHAELPESKIDGKVARHLDRDDFVANTIGTFLSLTAHCAQCHDHKFDPISQREYYGLQAVFSALDRADRMYDPDPVTDSKRVALVAQLKSLDAKRKAWEAEGIKRAGKPLQELDRNISESKRPNASLKPEYGYHSALSEKQDAVKWVQIDLGKRVTLDRVVLRASFDDFNNIGAGFGFPLKYKAEVSDEEDFSQPVLLADQTEKDQPNPGTKAVTHFAMGKTGRYLRVTATKLATRLATDFIFALAELEAFDGDGLNIALGKNVTAFDSIEAPVRWRRSNLTDGIFPSNKLSAAELARFAEQRERLLVQSLDPAVALERAVVLAKLAVVQSEIEKLPKTVRTAYIGTVHTGSGNFIGTGANGGKPRPIQVLPRGDVTKPGEEVGPSALAAIPVKFELPLTATESVRRAALAKWLSHPDNPLVWRSIVNRVWQYHFGRGLVETSNDFGRMGQRPTHPLLLDFLAAEFRDNGGSLKALHKRIVRSETYQQASTANAVNAKTDADNRYLWRQNRRKLDAEAMRDSILLVAGKLNLTMGGPSFQDFVVEKPEHSPHYQYHLHDPEDAQTHRRTIYRFVVRSKQQPFLAAFDCADPSLAVDKRNETITPQQALTLLNNRLSLAMAQHFATRAEKLAGDDAGRTVAAFKLAVGRTPTTSEARILTNHVKEFGLASVCRLILNLNEFAFVD